MTTNYSYYAVPFILLQPLFSSLRGPLVRLGVDNNVNPRIVLDQLEKSGKYSPNLIAKLRRRESSEKNLWEGMPMILAAIVAGNTAGLSAQWMNLISIGYFVIRCAFSESNSASDCVRVGRRLASIVQVAPLIAVYSYLNITDKKASYIRSVLWWSANGTSCYPRLHTSVADPSVFSRDFCQSRQCAQQEAFVKMVIQNR